MLSLFDEPNVKAPVFASKPQKVPELSLKSQLLVASPNCKIQSNRLIEQVGMLRTGSCHKKIKHMSQLKNKAHKSKIKLEEEISQHKNYRFRSQITISGILTMPKM